jgi:hypothetical protein
VRVGVVIGLLIARSEDLRRRLTTGITRRRVVRYDMMTDQRTPPYAVFNAKEQCCMSFVENAENGRIHDRGDLHRDLLPTNAPRTPENSSLGRAYVAITSATHRS